MTKRVSQEITSCIKKTMLWQFGISHSHKVSYPSHLVKEPLSFETRCSGPLKNNDINMTRLELLMSWDLRWRPSSALDKKILPQMLPACSVSKLSDIEVMTCFLRVHFRTVRWTLFLVLTRKPYDNRSPFPSPRIDFLSMFPSASALKV